VPLFDARQIAAPEELGEETLHEVLGILGAVPSTAEKRVQRRPVGAAERL
jgi:hypothetical protein